MGSLRDTIADSIFDWSKEGNPMGCTEEASAILDLVVKRLEGLKKEITWYDGWNMAIDDAIAALKGDV